MHLITGFLLALLARRKSKPSVSPLLGITTGPVRVSHLLPGRIRFYVPSLCGNEAACQDLQAKLGALAGLQSLDANHVTGSVLVHFEGERLEAGLLFAALVRVLGLEKEFERPPDPIVARELRTMMSSVNRAVFDRTGGIVDLWTALALLLAAIGLRRLYTDGNRAFPAGFTLLWWAWHSVMRRKGVE